MSSLPTNYSNTYFNSYFLPPLRRPDLQAGPHVPRITATAAAAVPGADTAIDNTVTRPAAPAAPAAVPSRRATAVARRRRSASVCVPAAAAAPIPDDVPPDTGAAAAGAAVLPEWRQPAATPSAARGADAAAQSPAVVVDVIFDVVVVCEGYGDDGRCNNGDELTTRRGGDDGDNSGWRGFGGGRPNGLGRRHGLRTGRPRICAIG